MNLSTHIEIVGSDAPPSSPLQPGAYCIVEDIMWQGGTIGMLGLMVFPDEAEFHRCAGYSKANPRARSNPHDPTYVPTANAVLKGLTWKVVR